jgi:hypothetical protein
MLKFADLTLSQKRFVVALLEANPQYKKTPQITLKECAAFYYEMRDQRTGVKGEKIGYPNWLFNKNKVERGVYQVPVPNATEMTAFTKEVAAKAAPKATAKAAKATAAKVVKVKTAKAAPAPKAEKTLEGTRLQKVIDESISMDDEVEDFNQILRENGIEV